MSATLQLTDAMTSRLRMLFPSKQVPMVEFHDGEIAETDLERYAFRAPAIVLTVGGTAGAAASGGSVFVPRTFALFIITKPSPDKSKSALALAIEERLLRFIPFENWCVSPKCGQAERIRSSNLYSSRLDEKGLLLWGVEWTQTIILEGLSYDCRGEMPEPEPFETAYFTTDIGQTEDTENFETSIELEQEAG
jgi:hypothetical protein